MADSVPLSLPLYEKIRRKNPIQRTIDVTILILLLSLVSYRLLHIRSHGFSWIIAIFCESCFAFVWFLTANIKWDPMEDKPYLDRLDKRTSELPAVDMFVTTADPVLEPPIITINTVLSLLAVNYPANKLACYVSDDGCSPLNYFSLVETAKFAKVWVPFCKKFNIKVRAPFRYFLNSPKPPHGAASAEFLEEYKNTKAQYEQLVRKLEDAADKSFPLDDFPEFLNAERRNHSSIVKVIWENMETTEDDESIPHLIYISREKRPNCPHHYKGGAMNVLTRVSGIMTNAPVMLNVDCDMYAHNPEIVRLAMCLFLGSDKDCAFVQSPQMFYDCPGNELIVLQEFMGHGLVGLRGPFYSGTGCFHKRRIIYGLSVDDLEIDGSLSLEAKGKLSVGKLNEQFGSSKELTKSASEAFEGNSHNQNAISNSLQAAHHVASCTYEDGTAWGKTIGWSYGSTAEDINTGSRIHSMGWKSLYSSPDPPGFLGCAPPGGPPAMSQQKRWAAGLLEVLFGPNCPIIGVLFGKLPVRQALAYLYVDIWGLRSVPELLYCLLPAYCVASNSSFLPQGAVIFIPLALFVIYNLYTLSEYLRMNLSVQSWWNAQQFARIKITGPWLFSVPEIALKLLGLSEVGFEITKKTVGSDNNDDQDHDSGRFVFDDSSYFIPGTAILMANVVALAGFFVRGGCGRTGLGDIFCSVWVVLSFWPFLRGLFEKGKYGIPFSTVCKSMALAFLFVHLSRRGSNDILA